MDDATKLAAVLGTIIEMSDDVTRASGAIDMQGRLLRLQNSIQKNRHRIATLCKPIAERLAEAEAKGGENG